MAKVKTKETTAEREAPNHGRFDDLWAISDAEIAAGMESLDLNALNEEVARRRGR